MLLNVLDEKCNLSVHVVLHGTLKTDVRFNSKLLLVTTQKVEILLLWVNFPMVIIGTDQNIIKNPVMIGWRTNL